jgi:hypothetical protein
MKTLSRNSKTIKRCIKRSRYKQLSQTRKRLPEVLITCAHVSDIEIQTEWSSSPVFKVANVAATDIEVRQELLSEAKRKTNYKHDRTLEQKKEQGKGER